MVGHAEFIAQAERRYVDFLRSIVAGRSIFPLELRLGKSRRTADYAAYQAQLAELRNAAAKLGIDVTWQSVNAPRFGQHDRPHSACFPHEQAYLAALDKTAEVAGFREDLVTIRAVCPQLEPWISPNVRRILAYRNRWPSLLRTVDWFAKNPQSNLYLRQLPIAGVDTKFFEKHASILEDLLAAALPERGDIAVTTFAERHGLRREEPLIRVRFLDSDYQRKVAFPLADFAIPVSNFRSLPFANTTAIVTENLRNFLALPSLTDGVAVLGGGHAVPLLAGAKWLEDSRIFYWGDIDAHGFLALSRFRNLFGNVHSLLMDEETFEVSKEFTGPVSPSDFSGKLNLFPDEQTLFERVSDGACGLEQERIPYLHVIRILNREVLNKVETKRLKAS
jgi:hypothetical protein